MKQIKAISFDLWNTLIKSNPEYNKWRNKYISLCSPKSEEEIDVIIANIKRDINAGVEKFGFHYSSIDVYKMIQCQCGVTGITHFQLMGQCERLFLQYPPLLVDGVVHMLKTLKHDKYDLYIASNTLLIDGKFLIAALEKLGIMQYFTRAVFSSDICVSKPNPEFFKYLHMCTSVLKHEILHVGDNQWTDKRGADNYGMNNYYIISTDTVLQFFNDFTNDKYELTYGN